MARVQAAILEVLQWLEFKQIYEHGRLFSSNGCNSAVHSGNALLPLCHFLECFLVLVSEKNDIGSHQSLSRSTQAEVSFEQCDCMIVYMLPSYWSVRGLIFIYKRINLNSYRPRIN